MANQKITDLTAGSRARINDLFECAQGTSPASRKLTITQILGVPVDIPPTTANALNDEFDDAATLPGGGSPLWTWDNQGGATVSVSDSSLLLTAPTGAGNNQRSIYQAAPATPWEFTAKIYRASRGINYTTTGLIAIDSISGRRMHIGCGFNANPLIAVDQYTNATTFNSTPATESADRAVRIYARVADTGTNLVWSYSLDGIAWIQLYSASRTAFLTNGANRIGLMAESNNASYPVILSCDWFRRTV